MSFQVKTHCNFLDGHDAVVLSYSAQSIDDSLSAVIIPDFGANLCRFSKGGQNIIDFDPGKLAAADFTGTPVLYPTPNRVRNAEWTFSGKKYEQKKNGQPRILHGLAYDEPFEVAALTAGEDCACAVLRLRIDSQKEYFASYPFESELELKYILSADGVKAEYTVRNLSGDVMPFGLALHPYFYKLGGASKTWLSVPASATPVTEETFYPTGEFHTEPPEFVSLKTPRRVGELVLDNDYTLLEKGAPCVIRYESPGFEMRLTSSDEFEHVMVYVPQGEDFFCVEHQTCSINAFNLHDQGKTELANLLLLNPGECKSGFIEYKIV